MTARISVVIPAYNAESTIKRAVDSVINQTRVADEIIIVDDGSSDRTTQTVEDNYGSKVRCIRQVNGGVASARNRGIRESTGNWIAFLDADDEWLPDKIAAQMNILEENPHLSWCAGNSRNIQGGVAISARSVASTQSFLVSACAVQYFKVALAGFTLQIGSFVIARHLLDDPQFEIRRVDFEDAAMDIDTIADLARLSRSARS